MPPPSWQQIDIIDLCNSSDEGEVDDRHAQHSRGATDYARTKGGGLAGSPAGGTGATIVENHSSPPAATHHAIPASRRRRSSPTPHNAHHHHHHSADAWYDPASPPKVEAADEDALTLNSVAVPCAPPSEASSSSSMHYYYDRENERATVEATAPMLVAPSTDQFHPLRTRTGRSGRGRRREATVFDLHAAAAASSSSYLPASVKQEHPHRQLLSYQAGGSGGGGASGATLHGISSDIAASATGSVSSTTSILRSDPATLSAQLGQLKQLLQQDPQQHFGNGARSAQAKALASEPFLATSSAPASDAAGAVRALKLPSWAPQLAPVAVPRTILPGPTPLPAPLPSADSGPIIIEIDDGDDEPSTSSAPANESGRIAASAVPRNVSASDGASAAAGPSSLAGADSSAGSSAGAGSGSAGGSSAVVQSTSSEPSNPSPLKRMTNVADLSSEPAQPASQQTAEGRAETGAGAHNGGSSPSRASSVLSLSSDEENSRRRRNGRRDQDAVSVSSGSLSEDSTAMPSPVKAARARKRAQGRTTHTSTLNYGGAAGDSDGEDDMPQGKSAKDKLVFSGMKKFDPTKKVRFRAGPATLTSDCMLGAMQLLSRFG